MLQWRQQRYEGVHRGWIILAIVIVVIIALVLMPIVITFLYSLKLP